MASLEEALEYIDEFVTRRMSRFGPPGAALAITDRDQTLAVRTYGYANLDGQVPLDPRHLFQIGSIGKSFTALAIMQECEAGRLTLEQPVTEILPWLDLPQKTRPITLHHLLSHTSGLVTGFESSPDPRSEVLSLRETDIGFPPGGAFSYSNAGFKILGFVLERVTGESYARVIESRILEPLGMNDSVAAVRTRDRTRTAVPYVRLYDDRPGSEAYPWVPAIWAESESGDGSVCATIEDAAVYLRMLMNKGRYPGGQIVSEASLDLMARPVAEDSEDPGTWYGYGLRSRSIGGHRTIGHSGAMVGHIALMISAPDIGDGYGIFLMFSAETNREPAMIAALHTLSCVADGSALSTITLEDTGERAVLPAEASLLEGQYGNTSETVSISIQDEVLVFQARGEQIPLEPRGEDVFFVAHPQFDWTLLRAIRRGGAVLELTHGPDVWTNRASGGFAAPAAADSHPGRWDAYLGHYRSWSAWVPSVRVVLRAGKLFLLIPDVGVDPGEEELELVSLPNGSFRAGAPEYLPDRVRFDTLIEGKAWRLRFSNLEFSRFEDV